MTISTTISQLTRRGLRISTGLTVLTLVNAVVLIFAVALRLLDPTLISGVPAWDKPIKFSLAFLAFGPTMLWIYARVKVGRVGRVGLELVGWSMVVEITLIVMQASRGVMSHFNYSTPFDAAVFSIMAAFTGVFALAALVVGVVLARRRLEGLLGLAITLSVPIMTLGAIQGFSMTAPKPGQVEAGRLIVGGHTIGGETNGPGLPIIGWSTEHGDLRVAHFIGLHVLQILPLAAIILSLLASRGIVRASERRQRGAIWAVGIAYVGVIFTLYIQAQRGQSVISPDWITALIAVVLIALPIATAVALVAVPVARTHPASGVARRTTDARTPEVSSRGSHETR